MRFDTKTNQMYANCDICKKEVPFGKGAYHIRKVERYNIYCCDSCWDGNWDGWNTRHEAFLLEKLKENNLPLPERNKNGLLPRE